MIQFSDSIDNLLNFFKVEKISDISWEYKVNDRTYLHERCDSKIMIVEGDIVYSDRLQEAIMAHPPDTESDLTFEEWISELLKTGKGAKLDFKKLKGDDEEPLTVPHCIGYICGIWDSKIPLILHADVAFGPYGDKELHTPISPDYFIQLYNQYHNEHNPNAILSLGWVTEYLKDSNQNKYTDKMIDDMLEIADTVEGHVSFSIRVGLIKNSMEQINRILDANQNYTLTVWKKQDSPNLETWIKENLNPYRTFYQFSAKNKRIN